ncbi:MAG: AraC-like DNA-binding protein [Oleiphilaceae bacterium]
MTSMKNIAPIASVSNAAVKDLIETCSALGIFNHGDLSEIGINPDMLNDPILRFPEQKLIQLWNLIFEISKRPEIGLLIGQRINPSAKGLLASWVSQADSIAEAIEIFRTNIPLMNPSESWHFQINKNVCSLVFKLDIDKEYPNITIERSMSAMVTWGRALSGHEFPIIEASFTFPPPKYHELFTPIFGSNIHFNKPENMLSFDSKLLELRTVNGNQFLKTLIENKAQSSLEILTSNISFSSNTKATIKKVLLKKGAISIDAVCAELLVSRQTLYRKLKNEGYSYKSLCDDYKKTESLRLLQITSENITNISFRLGFKDTSSFYKAFKRWFGMSPKSYIKK